MKAPHAVPFGLLALILLLPAGLAAGGASPRPGGADLASPAPILGPDDFAYRQIDYPGAPRTLVFGINSQGAVVGRYRSGTTWRGFVLQDDTYTDVMFPGSTSTTVLGVNSRGEMAGVGIDSNGLGHGFHLYGGVFTEITIEGGVDVYAWDVNDSGVVLGRYEDSTTHDWVNFLWRDGALTTLNLPAVQWAEAVGLNDRGEVAGHFVRAGDNTGHMIGFVYWKGGWTEADYPEPNGMACFQGIGDTGDVVGHVQLGAVVYGTIWANGAFTATLRFPGAKGTYPHGMTPSGILAGYFFDASGFQHGFVARRAR